MARLADEIMETEASMAAANEGAERITMSELADRVRVMMQQMEGKGITFASSTPSPAPAMRGLAHAAATLNLAASHVLDCDEAGDSGAQSDEWQQAMQALAAACSGMAEAIAENRDAVTIACANRLVDALDRMAAPTPSELVAALAAITDELENIIPAHIYDGDEPPDAPLRTMVNENRALIARASPPSPAPDLAPLASAIELLATASLALRLGADRLLDMKANPKSDEWGITLAAFALVCDDVDKAIAAARREGILGARPRAANGVGFDRLAWFDQKSLGRRRARP